eukprot:6160336-Alexandrium_andersonii.AAC.1
MQPRRKSASVLSNSLQLAARHVRRADKALRVRRLKPVRGGVGWNARRRTVQQRRRSASALANSFRLAARHS